MFVYNAEPGHTIEKATVVMQQKMSWPNKQEGVIVFNDVHVNVRWNSSPVDICEKYFMQRMIDKLSDR